MKDACLSTNMTDHTGKKATRFSLVFSLAAQARVNYGSTSPHSQEAELTYDVMHLPMQKPHLSCCTWLHSPPRTHTTQRLHSLENSAMCICSQLFVEEQGPSPVWSCDVVCIHLNRVSRTSDLPSPVPEIWDNEPFASATIFA